MFELPFLMLFNQKIDIKKITDLPNFENRFSREYAIHYLDLYKQMVTALENNKEETLESLRLEISNHTSKGAKSINKFGENDMSMLAGWFTNLLHKE